MKRILGLKDIFDLTLAIVLIGSIVLFVGFGSTIWIARHEVEEESDKNVNRSIELVQNYVDGQLQRVEDVSYTLLSSVFGASTRNAQGEAFVSINPATFQMPSEEEAFSLLEQFLNTNPHVCGVAIGFEPFLYTETKGEYGFAAYVTNVSGKNERLSLGEIHDFHQKEWYAGAASTNRQYWSHPFRETSQGKVVACFSVPLHGVNDRLIGVMAVDIDTELFRQKCEEVSPFPNADVTIVDSDFRFIAHPDSDVLLKTIEETKIYDDYKADSSIREKMQKHESGKYLVNKRTAREALFYFSSLERTGWTISIECPSSDVFSGVRKMKRDSLLIGLLSIIFMLYCFLYMFRRMKVVTQEKTGIERDLQIASSIQMGMLPKLYPAFPDRNELDIYGFLHPAKSVGGDLYDYFIRDEKCFFCIGDVSGKGVPASLYMAVIRALFRNVSLRTDDPAEIISSLNTALAEGNTHGMFCTMFLGVLDIKTGHVDYCNAGHNAPIIRRMNDDGKFEVRFTKPKVNIAIGVFDGFEYQKEEITIRPGEGVFLYTDGVTEAENANKELFGDDATLAALTSARDNNARSAKDFVEFVYRKVKEYAGDVEQSDDITMIVLEYKGA